MLLFADVFRSFWEGIFAEHTQTFSYIIIFLAH